MSLKRRNFLLFLGGGAASVALSSLQSCRNGSPDATQSPTLTSSVADGATPSPTAFHSIRGPLPIETDGVASAKQIDTYGVYVVEDDLTLPEGFTYDLIGAWGDKVGDSRFGYNNDYLSFVQTGADTGYLTINFEYISSAVWMQTYDRVIGKPLNADAVRAAVPQRMVNAFALSDKDDTKAKIKAIAKEALIDQGLGTIALQRRANGQWVRVESPADRRITGVSGLDGDRYLKATGPATAVFRKQKGKGYVDKLGDRIVGTFANCAGGTTPWGTVLSAEENYHVQVPEAVHADGTSFDPKHMPFYIDEKNLAGQGNVFGLAGNKYGWIVEVDPANPQDYGTKHTWLGRYRHEAVGVRVEPGKPLAFYSGCDRRGGHLYKFVSRESVSDPRSKANSKLLADGVLYAAKFNPDGTGRWIALNGKTPVAPDSPTRVVGDRIMLPQRPEGGFFPAERDEQIQQFRQQYKTLSDLYSGTPAEQQGAISIDAHFAANAAGATCTARPEDTEIAPDGTLYIAFTSGTAGSDGGPDRLIFQGPKGEVPYEYGWIMRLQEGDNDPAAQTFRWEMMAAGGEPTEGGLGFANPDNLLLDRNGDLWMVTDISTSQQNQPITENDDRGQFGNNSIWYIPTSGINAGKAYLFGFGPMECETCGPFLTNDQTTLFLAVQHPGEVNGTRQDRQSQTRKFDLKTTDNRKFVQNRQIPLGSNWPGLGTNDPPKPAVVAVRRSDRQPIVRQS